MVSDVSSESDFTCDWMRWEFYWDMTVTVDWAQAADTYICVKVLISLTSFRLSLCKEPLSWLWLCHSSSKATKGTIKCYVLHRVTWGLSSFMISSLQTSTHPPEMKINPPKMACGYPRGGVIENSHIRACPVECTCQCTSARK